MAELEVVLGGADLLEARERCRHVLLEKVRVAREGRDARVGRPVLVRGVHGEHLPVGLAVLGEPVHEAAGRRAEGAGLAVVGDGGDVAEHAHAPLERKLEALRLVEVQDRRAERPEEGGRLAALDLGGLAGHHVRDEVAHHGDLGVMRLGEARVDEHAHALVRARAPEAKDVVPKREGLELAVHEHGERATDGDGVAIGLPAVGVPAAAVPRETRAAVRVAQPLEAELVSVVDAGHARQRHLQERGHPQARLREAHLVVSKVPARTLALRDGVRVGRAAEHGEEALAVVAAEQVEGGVEVVARVVLAQLLEAGGKLGGADLPLRKARTPVRNG